MRISQYVYFKLSSATVPAAEITARLGVEPDRLRIRAAKQTAPPRPVAHSWALDCREPGLTLDEQIARVLDRVRPLAGEIRRIVDTLDVESGLTIVRYLDDEHGEDEVLDTAVTESGDRLERLAGQHQLLGW